MSHKQIMHKQIMQLASIVSVLGQATGPGESVPASSIYLALGADMGVYNRLASAGRKLGWLKTTAETIGLTAEGRVKAKQFHAVGI